MNQKRGTILVVDDTPAYLHRLDRILTEQGYTVRTFPSGPAALASLDGNLPDLILLDVVMPKMDGYTVCGILKANERTRHVPVMFISAMDRSLDKVKALTVGAVDYVVKPIQAEELLARIETHLSLQSLRKDLEARVALRTSELSEALERERTARAEAEAASHLKDEFLATLSHELRAPLQSIVGWTRLLMAGNLSPKESSHGLSTIERNARAQTKLVEDLLDMSRIVSGRMLLELKPVDTAAVVKAAIESVRPASDAKGVIVEQSGMDDLALVRADANRLHQVIWNLLTNAVKFTPRGGRVTVSVRQSGMFVELVVEDTGMGIRPEFLPHVFERFRQADASSTRAHGGLGLGLAIVRQLVELHGGAVRAESGGVDRGARFTVSLPLFLPDEALGEEPVPVPAHQGPRPDLAGIKVLVVDDEADTRDLIECVLTELHASVETAATVQEALAQLDRSHPAVVVCDLSMPGEDGYTLIRKIRELPRQKGGNIPALALSAYARAEDRAEVLKAGFQVHLAKPVEPWLLASNVASLAAPERSP